MRHRLTLGLLATTGVVLAGCGSAAPDGAVEAAAFECPLGEEGCDTNEPVGDGGEFSIVSSRESEFSFTFDEVEDVTSVTGEITVEFANEGNGTHNVEFVGAAEGSEVVEANGGEEASGSVGLFPGEWTYFCNIGDHRAQGMEATVQVFATQDELDAALEEGLDLEEDDVMAVVLED